MSYVKAKFSSGNNKIDSLVDRYARIYSLDANIMLAQLWQESRFNPRAVSPKGAKGIAQFMPATARRFGITDPFDIEQSIRGQAKYMRFLLDKFGDYALALAGYNAGEGNVKKYKGIPPFKETRNYVNSILNKVKKYTGIDSSDEKKNSIYSTINFDNDYGINESKNEKTISVDRNMRLVLITFLMLIIIYFVLYS